MTLFSAVFWGYLSPNFFSTHLFVQRFNWFLEKMIARSSEKPIVWINVVQSWCFVVFGITGVKSQVKIFRILRNFKPEHDGHCYHCSLFSAHRSCIGQPSCPPGIPTPIHPVPPAYLPKQCDHLGLPASPPVLPLFPNSLPILNGWARLHEWIGGKRGYWRWGGKRGQWRWPSSMDGQSHYDIGGWRENTTGERKKGGGGRKPEKVD